MVTLAEGDCGNTALTYFCCFNVILLVFNKIFINIVFTIKLMLGKLQHAVKTKENMSQNHINTDKTKIKKVFELNNL